MFASVSHADSIVQAFTVAWALFLFYTQEGHKIARCVSHIHSKVVSLSALGVNVVPLPSERRGRWAAGRTTQSCAVGRCALGSRRSVGRPPRSTRLTIYCTWYMKAAFWSCFRNVLPSVCPTEAADRRPTHHRLVPTDSRPQTWRRPQQHDWHVVTVPPRGSQSQATQQCRHWSHASLLQRILGRGTGHSPAL